MKTTRGLLRALTIVSSMLFFVTNVMAADKYPVPQTVKDWVSGGKYMKFEGLDIFVHSSGKAPVAGHGVLVVHGFPGSSWDFANVVPPVAKKTKIVVADMIGFGQSDKPKKGTYKDNFSLMRQADLYEAVAKAEGLKEVVLVAHDMGQTVGLELMARHDEGKLSFKIRHAILLDGSTLVDMVELVSLQVELLKQPDKAATEHLDFKEFAEGMRSSYGEGNATEEILNAQTAQVFAKDGDLTIAQTLKYLDERREFYDRWGGKFLEVDNGLARPPDLLEQLGLLPHVGERRPAFAALDELQTINWDYRTTRHSPRGHPLAPLRDKLEALDLPDAKAVTLMKNGRRVRYAGLVICRQRPGTANGVRFLNLEDETGLLNVVVMPQVWEAHYQIARKAVGVVISGDLEYRDGVTNLVAHGFEHWPVEGIKSRDFR